MSKYRVLEVVSGLGMGGAERSLLNRMNYAPDDFAQILLNVRPEIDVLQLDCKVTEYQVERKGVQRIIDIYRFLLCNSFDAIIVRTPLDAIRFGLLQFVNSDFRHKIVFEAHSTLVSNRFAIAMILRILLRLVFPKIDLIIAVSQSVSRGPQCFGHDNVSVVYLGSELRDLQNLETAPEVAHFIFVGRLVELKRPVWLLERILSISREQPMPPRVLTIVGSGPLEQELRDFISLQGLDGAIRYVGQQTNVAPYLVSATHLVSCSTHEGLPLTFFEAKLAGLAILATPSGGGIEIFGDEDRELQSHDEKEFEAALKEIIDMPPPTLEERREIQKKSSWMSAEHCAKQYFVVLSQLLSAES